METDYLPVTTGQFSLGIKKLNSRNQTQKQSATKTRGGPNKKYRGEEGSEGEGANKKCRGGGGAQFQSRCRLILKLTETHKKRYEFRAKMP